MATTDAKGYWRLVACLQSLRDSRVGLKRFCEASFDGVLCWPPALPGMRIGQPCPDFEGFISGRYVYRTCGVDSTWARFNKTWSGILESGLWEEIFDDELTDYTNCGNFTMDSPIYTGVEEMAGITTLEILGYVLKSLSILTLFVSACLYGCCVPAKTQRYKIFIPMFLSSMLKYAVCLVNMIVWRLEQDTQQTTVWRNPIVCKITNTITRFSDISVYSWIAVLGVYYLFAVLGDIIKDRRVMVLYLVGLGIPIVFSTAWALTVSFVLTSDVCYGGQIPHATHWITDAPKLACVLIAFCIFIVCVYAAWRGILDEDVPEFKFVKQGAIKCLLLLTLSTAVDLYLLVTVYNNGGTSRGVSSDSWTNYVTMIVESFIGTLTAFLLCFLDSEVHHCEDKPRKVNVVMVETGGRESEIY